jgi:hypothetical protein
MMGLALMLGAVGDDYLPNENVIRASYAPAGKHSRA